MLKVPPYPCKFLYFYVYHFLSFQAYYNVLTSLDFESSFVFPFHMLINSPSRSSSFTVHFYLVLFSTPSKLQVLFDKLAFFLGLISSVFLQLQYNLRD